MSTKRLKDATCESFHWEDILFDVFSFRNIPNCSAYDHDYKEIDHDKFYIRLNEDLDKIKNLKVVLALDGNYTYTAVYYVLINSEKFQGYYREGKYAISNYDIFANLPRYLEKMPNLENLWSDI